MLNKSHDWLISIHYEMPWCLFWPWCLLCLLGPISPWWLLHPWCKLFCTPFGSHDAHYFIPFLSAVMLITSIACIKDPHAFLAWMWRKNANSWWFIYCYMVGIIFFFHLTQKMLNGVSFLSAMTIHNTAPITCDSCLDA